MSTQCWRHYYNALSRCPRHWGGRELPTHMIKPSWYQIWWPWGDKRGIAVQPSLQPLDGGDDKYHFCLIKGTVSRDRFGFRWHVWLVQGLNRGRGQFLNLYLDKWFYNSKCVFLAVNASLRWLNNVVGVYLVQVSWLLIGQQGLLDFFRYRPLLPIGWRNVEILRQRRRKTTNTAPTTLSAIQAASQYTFVNTQLYSTLVISRNDKNKQLTVIKPT